MGETNFHFYNDCPLKITVLFRLHKGSVFVVVDMPFMVQIAQNISQTFLKIIVLRCAYCKKGRI